MSDVQTPTHEDRLQGRDAGAPQRSASRRDHLERAVLDVLWDHPDGIAGAQVLTALEGREVALTTVLTVLERMRLKGLVTRRRSGRSYRHQATATREEARATAVLTALGDGPDRAAALAHLVAVAEPDDLAALREALLPPTRRGDRAAPVCGPGRTGTTGRRSDAELPPSEPATTGCGGVSDLCGCCTCEPGCACCDPLTTTG